MTSNTSKTRSKRLNRNKKVGKKRKRQIRSNGSTQSYQQLFKNIDLKKNDK